MTKESFEYRALGKMRFTSVTTSARRWKMPMFTPGTASSETAFLCLTRKDTGTRKCIRTVDRMMEITGSDICFR